MILAQLNLVSEPGNKFLLTLGVFCFEYSGSCREQLVTLVFGRMMFQYWQVFGVPKISSSVGGSINQKYLREQVSHTAIHRQRRMGRNEKIFGSTSLRMSGMAEQLGLTPRPTKELRSESAPLAQWLHPFWRFQENVYDVVILRKSVKIHASQHTMGAAIYNQGLEP